jgi:hypothetical protein
MHATKNGTGAIRCVVAPQHFVSFFKYAAHYRGNIFGGGTLR